LVEQLRDHLLADEWGGRNYNRMNAPLGFMHSVARTAVERDDYGLLEDAAEALFEADHYCNRYDQRRRTRDWLVGLRGDAAETAAQALKRVPRAADWYVAEDWSPPGRAHGAIVDALQT
jgi:hypothetical protein